MSEFSISVSVEGTHKIDYGHTEHIVKATVTKDGSITEWIAKGLLKDAGEEATSKAIELYRLLEKANSASPEELKEYAIEFAEFCEARERFPAGRNYDLWLAERNKPKLFDGLTWLQWEQVADREKICEFWDDSGTGSYHIGLLVGIDDGFEANDGSVYEHCRPHHSQSQYCNDGKRPDWLKDDYMVLTKDIHGEIKDALVEDIEWDEVVIFQVLWI
ncbi:MAG: hypothetical protein R8M45_05075 [Ghiorsea sp.]